MSARGGVEARNERDATLGCEYRGRRNPEGMALISRPQDALRRNSFRVFRVFRVLPFLGANGKSLESRLQPESENRLKAGLQPCGLHPETEESYFVVDACPRCRPGLMAAKDCLRRMAVVGPALRASLGYATVNPGLRVARTARGGSTPG